MCKKLINDDICTIVDTAFGVLMGYPHGLRRHFCLFTEVSARLTEAVHSRGVLSDCDIHASVGPTGEGTTGKFDVDMGHR